MGVGAMDYPAEFQGTSQDTLNKLGISKVMTLTSTYDHRVIQGAASGEFLRVLSQLLLGENDFYDEIFKALRIPYEPVRWLKDIDASHDDDVTKAARVFELIHSYRVRGHVMADTDPLEYRQRKHPDLDITEHGLTLWDLERDFAVGGFAGKTMMKLRDILGVLRESYCRTTGIEFMHIQEPKERKWLQDRVERPRPAPEREEQLRILRRLNAAEAFETFPADEVRRPEAVLAGGRRVRHPAARRGHRLRRRGAAGRGRHRHGPPRPAERPGEHRRQVVRADLPGVRGQPRPAVDARLR